MDPEALPPLTIEQKSRMEQARAQRDLERLERLDELLGRQAELVRELYHTTEEILLLQSLQDKGW